MADVDSALKDWSATSSNNKPTGATTIGTGLDDNLREMQGAIIRGLSYKGADIASASTTDLGAVEGLMHDITGTTAITSFGTVRNGIWKVIKFEGALTLTHGSSLVIPGAANITTADGDIAIVISEGSGVWRVVSYFKAGSMFSTLTGTEELTNKTLTTAVAKGTWTASGTWTLPAFTLGGNIAGNGKDITGLATFSTSNATTTVMHQISSSTTGATLQAYTGGGAFAIYSTSITPGSSNYSFYTTGGTTDLNGSTNARILSGGAVIGSAISTGFIAGSDNSLTLGGASNRWSVVYAGTGAINTSDAREKTEVRRITAAEKAAGLEIKAELGVFRFLDAVAEKGEAARFHVGLTVQRAIEIMQSHGLDAFKYGFICYDEWPESVEDVITENGVVQVTKPAGNRYGFRTDELMMFILAAEVA